MARQRTEQTRMQILEAAARAVTQRGLGAVTIQDIAREAKLTPPTLYAYFQNKSEIVRELFDVLREEAGQAFEMRFPSGLDFEKRLEALLLRQCEFIERRRDLIALVLSGGMMAADPEFCASNRQHHAQHHARFQEWLRRESADVEWAASLEDVTLTLSGIMHAFFARWLELGAKHPFAVHVPVIVKLFMQGARAQPKQVRKSSPLKRRARA